MPIKSLLLVNPHSGLGKSMEAANYIKSKLQAQYVFDEVLSQYPSYFIDYLKKCDLSEYQHIIVIGGDGTMHEVVNGLAEKENLPSILLFPCGSGNAFNHDIDCLTWDKAIANLQRNTTKKIDIFRLNFSDQPSLYAFNIVGWGLVSDINQTAENLRWIGPARYTLAALIHIFKNPPFKATLKINEQTFEGDFCFVLACNTQHTGKAMKMAPLAELSDGFLDVLVVKKLPIYKLLQLFPKIFSGQHIHSPLLNYIKTRSFSLVSEPQTLNIDGETKCHSPFSVEVLPLRLEMVV
jgi:YegS/Rv2252/BmrU family lipid kinase